MPRIATGCGLTKFANGTEPGSSQYYIAAMNFQFATPDMRAQIPGGRPKQKSRREIAGTLDLKSDPHRAAPISRRWEAD